MQIQVIWLWEVKHVTSPMTHQLGTFSLEDEIDSTLFAVTITLFGLFTITREGHDETTVPLLRIREKIATSPMFCSSY